MKIDVKDGKAMVIYNKILAGREQCHAKELYLWNIGIMAVRNNEEPLLINYHEVLSEEFAKGRLDSLINKVIGEYDYQRHQIVDSWLNRIINVSEYDVILRKNNNPIIIDHSDEKEYKN